MKIFHISAECYPAAKVGGLADVVGSLPKYLQQGGFEAPVIIPKYSTKWLAGQPCKTVYHGKFKMGNSSISFDIQKVKALALQFPLYVVDVPAYFARPGIYVDPQTGAGYEDEAERFIGFQIAALRWLDSLPGKPDIIHCHDHHTALIPFMMRECKIFESLGTIPTLLTVHNAQYQGIYPHEKQALLPVFDREKAEILHWNGQFNSLAAGLKCCGQITTVSPAYMQELRQSGSGLEALFIREKQKSRGILNGIDTAVWNPATDNFLPHHYTVETRDKGKAANKKQLCRQFSLTTDRPLISFIGRLAGEKGADLLPDLFTVILEQTSKVSFLVLGTGQPQLQSRFEEMKNEWVGFFDASLNYNEQLAHQIYAGSDFIIMPSRVEPCGLNQMYAMRYGTVPIVRAVGGLKDSVRDVRLPEGYGITFQKFTLEEATEAVNRALGLYKNEALLASLRERIMGLNYSWNDAAKSYIAMYKQLINAL